MNWSRLGKGATALILGMSVATAWAQATAETGSSSTPPPAATQSQAPPANAPAGNLRAPTAAPARPTTPQKTIGKLGQATAPSSIRSTMSTRGRVLSRVKAFQYLVINRTKNSKWVGVVLVNGKIGYIPADDVVELPYDVQVPVGTRTSRPTASRSGTATVASGDVGSMLNYSTRYIGNVRYQWGGNSLSGGIDCSAFVQQMFARLGVRLPRTAAEQARVGTPVTRLEDLRPGDRLYFWERRRNMIGHTGIFMGYHADGGAYFIHSSSGRRGVAVDDLRKGNWLRILVAARRD